MSDDVAGLVRTHPFFRDLDDRRVEAVARCGTLRTVPGGVLLAREGAPARAFHVLLRGRVAVTTRIPGGAPTTLQTLEGGDVVGWSWITDRAWAFDVGTLTETAYVALDAVAFRELLEGDPGLGAELLGRLNRVMGDRLRAARLQGLDLYGEGRPS